MKKIALALLTATTLLSGCATKPAADYTAFRQAHPKSILVLPPVNNSTDVRASYSVLSTVTAPLAEAGYYVFPVAVVEKTFKENGLQNPGDIRQTPLPKLQQIFGADSVLYISVEKYGSVYMVIQSNVIVTAKAELVDARTGVSLWKGQATASSAEGQNNGGGIAGILVAAVVKQLIHSVGDSGYPIAQMTSQRLLSPASSTGLLYGPRSPLYGTDKK